MPVLVGLLCVLGGAALFGWSVLLDNPAFGILGLVALVLVLVCLHDPFWGLVLLTAQFAILPCGGTFFGHYVPNVLQVGVPAVFAFAFLAVLKRRGDTRPIPSDFLLLGFGLWGLLGLIANESFDTYYKQYGNKMLFPMGFYFITRLVPLDAERATELLRANLTLVAIQSFLMVQQGTTGQSSIYTTFDGKATGPFQYIWEAAPYMVMWVPIFIHALHNAHSSWRRALLYLGLALNAYAVTLTQQRGATTALLVAIPFCLLSESLRPSVRQVLLLGLLAYIPWATSALGTDLLNRFDQKDESRAALRETGYAILRSPEWDPLYGIGFYQSHWVMRDLDPSLIDDRTVLMWGKREKTVTEVAEAGKPLHNFYLSLLIEFGAVGALLWAGLMLILIRSVYTAFRRARDGLRIDDGLYVTLLAMLVAWGGIAYLHNVYRYEATMSVFWFVYGLIVGHPKAFHRAADPVSSEPAVPATAAAVGAGHAVGRPRGAARVGSFDARRPGVERDIP